MHQQIIHQTAHSVAGAKQMHSCKTIDTALDFDSNPLSKGFLIPALGKRQSLQRHFQQNLQQRYGQLAQERFENHNHTDVISSTMHLYTHSLRLSVRSVKLRATS